MTHAITAASLDHPVLHHGSHRNLLTLVAEPRLGTCEVDAIIVPTSRPAGYLRRAVELAAKLRCTLVTLNSQHSRASQARSLAWSSGVDIAAVDMRDVSPALLPAFGTTSLLAGTPFARGTDTSRKRNMGLLVARLAGWKHVVFLDDDITIPDPQHLTDAVRLLHQFDGVGLTVGGFPDNSVVCHAHRETGGVQDTFVGGGALAVNAASCESFFPDVYNEDWFFLLNDTRLRPIAKTTGLAVQKPYDPFASEQRARTEEFGDVLAEGVFWLLDQGKRVQDADEDYWRKFLAKRLDFINGVLRRVDEADVSLAECERMKSALRAARGRCTLITPDLCVQYLKAWRTDRGKWRRHLEKQERTFTAKNQDMDEVLLMLGISQPSSFTNTVHSSRFSTRVPSASQSR
ncbi:glycosyltransferase family A protein [Kutzneria sp. 744]|uniref:glycosyltransferase family A protein n=1 Tax=Kutzneria sp. (strain 744) TaxID=345341 RepID=UPI0003EEC826|nr:glycosyltransferase family A protein [Kutzneria sp. 744]EWM10935.1 LigA protein [Kutzneria sp. 744]